MSRPILSCLASLALASGVSCGGDDTVQGQPAPSANEDAQVSSNDSGSSASSDGATGPNTAIDAAETPPASSEAGDAPLTVMEGGDAALPPGDGAVRVGMTYADYAKLARTSMITTYYTAGRWRALPGGGGGNHDWGNDAMTYALYFDWLVNKVTTAPAQLDALAGTMNTAPAPCAATANCGPWSDEYLWDSIAGSA